MSARGAAITAADIRWARDLARYTGKPLPWMDMDDAESIGLLALVETARRWRPDGGASLRTLAYQRIQGAVIDAHRMRHQIQRATKQRRGDEVALPVDDFLSDGVAASRMEASADLIRVLEAIDRLDDVDRDALLRHVHGETLSNADRDGRSKSWMCRVEQRARLRLIAELERAA